MTSNTTTDKQNLRRQFRAKRNALSRAQQQQAAKDLATRFIQSGLFKDCQHIAMYLSSDGELDTEDLIHVCWQGGKHVYLPVLHPFCTGQLLFLSYTPTTIMTRNKYNIFEPKLDIRLIRPIHQLDAIMMPLVAFDEMGNRLGMGGGYYDRTLAQLHGGQTRLIGLAHDCQLTRNLPLEPWDIPLSAIMTPSQMF